MKLEPETPWDGTPGISARITVAINRVASVLRAGTWQFATAASLDPTQAHILQLLRDRTHDKVKGGRDVHHGVEPGESKWLVCSCGDGSITWWEQMHSTATSCIARTREGGHDPLDVKATCK